MRADIADRALVPVLNAVTLVGLVYRQSDVLTRYPRISAFWAAAREEPVNAQVIGEKLAAVPPAPAG